MTPGARIAAAIEVLEDIAARRRPIAAALKDWGLAHRFAGSRDRAAIGNIVYDAERRRRSLAWVMGAETPRALALGAVGIGWGVGADQLAAQLEAPHSPAPLTNDERQRLAAANLGKAPDAVRADVPDWLVPSLARGFGDGWVAELEAMTARPPLDLRVNRLKSDRAKVLRALAAQGAVEMPFSPDGLRVPPTDGERRHPNLQAEPGFQKGWFEIQDEGSQLAALMVGATAGEQILDLCAGGGGKTLALAAAMANKGQIHATDNDKHRLAPIFERLRRAGTRNVQVHPAGSDLSGLTGTMDRVLIDAPCSGSGTWRRHPDAKWRLSERALADRVAEQAALLRQAAGFVRPGGLLIYVTCSLLPEENEDQMAAFLADRTGFAALPADEIAAAGLAPDAATALAAAAMATPHGLQLTPLRTGTDGFFVGALPEGRMSTEHAARHMLDLAGRRVFFVMATQNEYGEHLRKRILPLICGVGPVEAAVRTSAALAALAAAYALPDLVVSLGSAGSRSTAHIYQVESVAYRDMDASALGFDKGQTPFADLPIVIDIEQRVPGIPAASISTGANIVTGAGYDDIAADMVDMESFAVLRAADRFDLPMIGIRGISDGKSDLTGLHDWTEYLHIIDEKLAAAIDLIEGAIADGHLVFD